MTRASINQVLTEMGRSDGIYFEEKVNTDGDGRFFQVSCLPLYLLVPGPS